MTPFAPNSASHNGCYFERTPEKLVLEGYRRWMAGYDTGSVAPWETTWQLYGELLGAADGRRAVGELSHFVRTLRHCAACPLRSFPFGAHHVCRDECLTLGLIAGLQHEDRATANRCLKAMPGALRRGWGSRMRLRASAGRPRPDLAADTARRDRGHIEPRDRATLH